ncbi:MAG TPA: 2-amino-4-hydroxy-6-hydroxymethyldihydropteridine diphosphokinase [Caulobacteraceae bacterium]|nr:2-amino-4-hydroxy-6-hydroxymethyldihydropteridine diphosphokinase [Caulobacteraceae bacterium]
MPILPGSRSAPHDEAIILALGGDLAGDYPSLEALLEAALSSFPRAGLRIVRRSGWWRSAAWPDPSQPAYLNGVVIVETALSPDEVLAAVHALEADFGRKRGLANAPRTLDIDLIAYGRRVTDAPGMTVPHPRAAERRFVMGPLAEIAPDWVHPRLGKTAVELAACAAVGADATPVG